MTHFPQGSNLVQMKFLKGLALGLLGFLLFISLNIFSLATWLNMTALSPSFVSKEITRLDVASIASEAIIVQNADEMQKAAVDILKKLEPEIDRQLTAAIYSVYDYILGKKDNPELAKTLRATFLSKSFIDAAVAEIDPEPFLNTLVEPATLGGETNDIQSAMTATAVKMAPQLKQQMGNIADPILAYLTDETQSIDLAKTLRSTLLSPEFISAAIDELDLSALLTQVLGEELAQQLPPEMSSLATYINANLPKTIAAIEPVLKQQLKAAAVPIADYLVGESTGFSVSIQLDQLAATLKSSIKAAILASPPPELAGLPSDAIEAEFDSMWDSFTSSMPATMTIDEQVFGPETQAQITGTLAQLQNQLADVKAQIASGLGKAEEQMGIVRTYIGYYQTGYWLLIVFMLLLIAGIVLIYREVKGAARNIGTTFLTFGIVGVAIYFIAKYFGGSQLASLSDIPSALQVWLPQFLDNLMMPELVIGTAFAVLGLILIIVSIVYKPRQAALPPIETTDSASPAA